MYDDFKRRVCDGREISPDVIEGIAGGRVLSGLKAFELNAPKELIRQIKGLDVPPLDVPGVGAAGEGTTPSGGEAPVDASKSEGEESVAVALLPEDQETSPFAVPELAPRPAEAEAPASSLTSAAATSTSSVEVPSSAPLDITNPATPTPSDDPASANASTALATSSAGEQAAPSATPPPRQVGSVNGAAGTYEYEPGPYGRGLIDGLGGLRDSAIYACQLFVRHPIRRSFLLSLGGALC